MTDLTGPCLPWLERSGWTTRRRPPRAKGAKERINIQWIHAPSSRKKVLRAASKHQAQVRSIKKKEASDITCALSFVDIL